MRKRKTLLIGAFCLFLFLPLYQSAASPEPTVAAKQEISHLLDYLENSGCQFCRNGKWYDDMKAAREHAELKYRYFTNRGQIHSAEDFIKRAASKSEMSGKPYLVRCGNGAPAPTAEWLTEELHRFREHRPPSPLQGKED